MDIKIEGNKIITTSEYNVLMIKALPHLEGFKRWGANRAFTFENTPYNIKIWKSIFPKAKVEIKNQENPHAVVAGGIFDVAPQRPTFQYKTPPRDHQKRALEKINSKKELPNVFGLFMDIGTGKSWTGITVMGQLWCSNEIDAVLLVAKNGVNAQWVREEIPKHMSDSVNWKAWIWDKTKKGERDFQDLLKFDGLKIFSINIDALITVAGTQYIKKFLENARGRSMMIVDESQDIKNISAMRTKAAIKFGGFCKYRMIMTGTPIAKNLVDTFSQFKFLDDRIFGHKYMTTFRSKYCVLKDNGFGLEIVGHKNIDNFHQNVDPHIFRINADEVLDLPPKVYIKQIFTLNEEQKRLIKELRQTFTSWTNDGKQITAINAASVLTRMQQISCGFIVDENGLIHSISNPRMEALKNVLEQREGKAIIWCRFNEDVRKVAKELGSSAVDYYGGTDAKNRQTNIQKFLSADSGINYLVASPEAAGTGLNLQGFCRTNVYYSNSFNSLARWQSEGRTWRDGTTGSVVYIDLIAKGSPDSMILKNLQDKKSISDLALDEYRKLIMLEEFNEIF